ncbi:unnamed protein product, partial [Rotaria sordida]
AALAAVPKNTPPPVRNKVEQCGGNACARCRKCIDWSYDGDMHDDYKLYHRDNKCNKILDKNCWHRRPDATCHYYSGCSHFYGYDSYHSHYYGGYHVCVCEKLYKRK